MRKITIIFLIALGIIGIIAFSDYKEAQRLEKQTEKEQLEILKTEIEILKNKKLQIITKTIDNTKYITSNETDLAGIIDEWTPRVAFVLCRWDRYQGPEYASGSATMAVLSDIGITGLTNEHVFMLDDLPPTVCELWVNGSSFLIDNSIGLRPFYGGYDDIGYIRVDNPDNNLVQITNPNIKVCKKVEIGDKLVILGYPGIGSQESITATEGIVSGIESNYYVTSAKIEHGNSGGAAILLKDDCYLGIPSSSIAGEIESMGRIYKADFILGYP